jgi:integrase
MVQSVGAPLHLEYKTRLNEALPGRYPHRRSTTGASDHRSARRRIASSRAKHDPSADLRGALKSPGRTRGHKAMPIDEMPTFLKSLETYDGDQRTRLALRLMVLTFARTTELRAARWSEIENIDGNDPLWRIPAARAGKAMILGSAPSISARTARPNAPKLHASRLRKWPGYKCQQHPPYDRRCG